MQLSQPAQGKCKDFLAATYQVQWRGTSFEFRINAPHRSTDALLNYYDVTFAAFITAWNPDGQQVSRENNLASQAQLIETLTIAGYDAVPGKSFCPESAQWTEPSVLVPGLNMLDADRLAVAFKQLAWVRLAKFKPARLQFTRRLFKF